MTRRTRALLCTVVILLCASVATGCSPTVAESPAVEESGSAPNPPATMPDVTGKSAGSIIELLESHPGTVVVSFAATSVVMNLGERVVAGVTKPPRTATVEIGERMLLLSDIRPSDAHVIIGQTPEAGLPLDSDTEVRLMAGAHPGPADATWVLDGHTVTIREGGADPCFECHTPKNCADCHTQYLE